MFSAFKTVGSHLSSNKDNARLDRTSEPLLSLGELTDEGLDDVAVLAGFLVVQVVVVHEVLKSSTIVKPHHGVKLSWGFALYPLAVPFLPLPFPHHPCTQSH